MLFVSSMGNFNISILDHMKKMVNIPILRNIGHFDNAMDLASFEDFEGMKINDIPSLRLLLCPRGRARFKTSRTISTSPRELDEKVTKLYILHSVPS